MRLRNDYNYIDLFETNRKDQTEPNFLSTYIWLNVLNIIFAFLSLILNVLHFKSISGMYTRLRIRYQGMKRDKRDYQQKLQNKINLADSSRQQPGFRINDSVDGTLNGSIDSMGTFRNSFEKDGVMKSGPTRSETSITEANIVDWESLTLADKALMYNKWTFVVIIGDIFLIVGSAFLIFNSSNSFEPNNHILGLSAIAHW